MRKTVSASFTNIAIIFCPFKNEGQKFSAIISGAAVPAMPSTGTYGVAGTQLWEISSNSTYMLFHKCR